MTGRLEARRAARRQEKRERELDIARALSNPLRFEAIAMARSRAITQGEFAQSEYAREHKCSNRAIGRHFNEAVKRRALKLAGVKTVAGRPELSYLATYQATRASRAMGARPWSPFALVEAVRRLFGPIARRPSR